MSGTYDFIKRDDQIYSLVLVIFSYDFYQLIYIDHEQSRYLSLVLSLIFSSGLSLVTLSSLITTLRSFRSFFSLCSDKPTLVHPPTSPNITSFSHSLGDSRCKGDLGDPEDFRIGVLSRNWESPGF